MEPYYADESVTLYHGDNAAILPQLAAGSVDLVFTSPPYNLGNTSGSGVRGLGHYNHTAGMRGRGGHRSWRNPALAGGYGDHDDNMPHDEYVAWQHATLRALWPLLAAGGAIYYNHKPRVLGGRLITPLAYVPPDLLDQVRQEVIWARAGGFNHTGAFYTPTHERIVIIARAAFRLTGKAASAVGDVWQITQERNNPHPAPFPLALPLRAIGTTTASLVLDPFAGSGTSLVAAKLLGRRAIGIELTERHCAQAASRLEQTQPEGREAIPLFDMAVRP